MNRLLRMLLPTKTVAARLEKALERAVSRDATQEAADIVSELLLFLLEKEEVYLLSDFILAHSDKIETLSSVERQVSPARMKEIVGLLEENHLSSVALTVCHRLGYDMEAMEILARQGRVDDLLTVLKREDGTVDGAQLETAVRLWERHQGSVQDSPRMSDILRRIASFAPERLPDNPRVKEIAGQAQEAAALYAEEGDLRSAARCYESASMYDRACRLYQEIGEDEEASQAAESMGDLEKALELAVDPERKLKLLIRTDRLSEARDFAAGFESPDAYFDLIKEQAKRRMEAKIKAHDFVSAVAFADAADCDPLEREKLVSRGREHLDRRMASAASEEEVRSIYRERVDLEEKAGHFEEAARLAEDVLDDLPRASFLYEKANLFNRAIKAASGEAERLAELHEKGGSLLKAANHYESAEQYERAYRLYERTEYFEKALNCYLKTENPRQDILLELYTKAGEFEQAIDGYLASGRLSDLEKALSLATTHDLVSYVEIIEGRIAELVTGSEDDLDQYFARAKEDVLETYAETIGIDFGTTNSVVAVFNRETEKAETIVSPDGSPYVPSFFGLTENHRPIFGEAARLRSLTAPDRVVARVKRSLGEERYFSIARKTYRSEEVVASILRHLVSIAEAYVESKVEAHFRDLVRESDLRFPARMVDAFLGEQEDTGHVEDVVLSVPAYFNDNQKRATRDSAEIAGIRVRRLLHEPSAAALAYAHRRLYSGNLAVIDLGGGTLDISIVEIDEGVTDVQNIGGDTKLGGSDIDALLVERVKADIEERWDVRVGQKRQELARLRYACENLKIDLSSVTQATMTLPHFLNRPKYTFSLTRSELERLSQPILSRIRSTIQETMDDYDSRVDNYILVGNATKMPAFQDLVRDVMPAEPLGGIDPGTAVASGAALQGAVLRRHSDQLVLLDVVPYSLGIQVIKQDSKEQTISRLIEKNARIPIKTSDTYTTERDNQRSVHIKVYQGESPHPHENYLLGDFVLEGIPPAPAHTPQIEVTFDIGSDCVLTVMAVDKGTGNRQSVKIEGAAVLSSQEKERLSRFFAERETVHTQEKALEQVRAAIAASKVSCGRAIDHAESTIERFFERFHEKLEVNPTAYRASPDQMDDIQAMFIQKDQFVHGLPEYRDQLASIISNVEQLERKHLNFRDPDISRKLRKRVDALTHYKEALERTQASVEREVTTVVENWIRVLDGMAPNLERMDPVALAGYHLSAGRAHRATDALQPLVSQPEAMTREAFDLLLACHVALGSQEGYREAHHRFGARFGLVYPDFNHLNAYLKAVDESVFMVHGRARQQGTAFGSGFAIAPHLVATNRHVVESMVRRQIRVVGKHTSCHVDGVELDPTNDLAVLRVSEELKPLRVGGFEFVEPGEQVLALGFPAPSSGRHSENIYISRGIVNSIRKTEAASERVIFVDTKIGSGMSGGPLINALGEVVGIVTLTQYRMGRSSEGMLYVEDQPIALPIGLVRRYVTRRT